jgi:hypothetical protein
VEGKNTMTRENESRNAEQRENSGDYTYNEPNWLEIPDTVTHRFQNEGMTLRWIRISIKDQEDYKNMGKKMQEGWDIVQAEEVPEMMHSSIVREEGRYTGAVCRGDLALAKMPVRLAESRREFFENKSKEVVDAVNIQLMRNSDSRMPISNTSRSQVTTGRRPSFQD